MPHYATFCYRITPVILHWTSSGGPTLYQNGLSEQRKMFLNQILTLHFHILFSIKPRKLWYLT